MKKIGIVFVSIVILLTSVLLVGCKEKGDGFELVKSISFVSNGESKVIHSTASYILDGGETESNYDEWRKNEDYWLHTDNPYYSFPLNVKILADKKKDTYYYYTRRLGDYVYYLKVKIKGYEYNYLYVKVIDNETIEIKKDDKITLYKVTSYSITHFEN